MPVESSPQSASGLNLFVGYGVELKPCRYREPASITTLRAAMWQQAGSCECPSNRAHCKSWKVPRLSIPRIKVISRGFHRKHKVEQRVHMYKCHDTSILTLSHILTHVYTHLHPIAHARSIKYETASEK
eukprot:4555509-Pyramimonas_sp.AAC.1